MKFVDTTNISSVEDVNQYLQFSDAGYYILTVYHGLALVIGLFGNSLVLYGSIRFNAIEEDNISTLLIEALAISDLLVLMTLGMAMWTTLISRRWIQGPAGCFIQGILMYICLGSEMILIMSISCYRFHALNRPFSSRTLSPRTAKIFVAAVYTFMAVSNISSHFMGMFYYFTPYTLGCRLSSTRDGGARGVIRATAVIILVFILPLLIILITNIGVLVIASKNGKKFAALKAKAKAPGAAEDNKGPGLPGRNAIITVSCIAWTFVVSVTPNVVRVLFEVYQFSVPAWGYITALEMQLINSIVNPLIYTITNHSFRRFMLSIFNKMRNKDLVRAPTIPVGTSIKETPGQHQKESVL